MIRDELERKKQKGDWVTVAKMLKISVGNAKVIWQRPKSKRYQLLVQALKQVIEARDQLIKDHEKKEEGQEQTEI